MTPGALNRRSRPVQRISCRGARVALQTPVDIASLAYFRIAFGLMVAWEGRRILLSGGGSRYLEKSMLFTYWPFDFLASLPDTAIKGLPYLMMLSALCFAAGTLYRVSAGAMFVSVTCLFLLEKSYYLNHMYLVCLVCFLMIFLPAHREWSLDVHLVPTERRALIPAWNIWLLRFQIGVPYFFAGVAKLTEEWFRHSEPLGLWMSRRMDLPFVGQHFDNEVLIRSMALGSLLFDLSVVWFLLNRRTRPFAYLGALLFHLANSVLFDIGIFPWTMIIATALFFPPEWPRRLIDDLRARSEPGRVVAFAVGALLAGTIAVFVPRAFSPMHLVTGGLGGGIAAYFLYQSFRPEWAEPSAPAPKQALPLRRGVMAALGIWMAIQLVIPMRHLLIPGDVSWTEEGHRFSWRMLLRDKEAETVFFVHDPDSGESWRVEPLEFLSVPQTRAMEVRPDMILQFAHYLRDRGIHSGRENVEVRVRAMVSFNGKPHAQIIDPSTDLAQVNSRSMNHSDWISLESPPR